MKGNAILNLAIINLHIEIKIRNIFGTQNHEYFRRSPIAPVV